MAYWLLKSEPDTFSLDDLERVGVEPWSGVRNYQARNFLRQMQPGDGFFFYHSSCAQPAIVGLGEVASPACADPSQFDATSAHFDARAKPAEPRWSQVEVRFVRRLRQALSLDKLRSCPDLQDFALVKRGNRLSVLPVSAAQWQAILKLEAQS